MGHPTVAQSHDGKIIDQPIAGEESYISQNEKSEARGFAADSSSSYNPESPPSSDHPHGDMFDDEKELAQHPDSITEGAELGQQKAEAAALAWSWPALVGIYAWSVDTGSFVSLLLR
jgi:hypothetical protein